MSDSRNPGKLDPSKIANLQNNLKFDEKKSVPNAPHNVFESKYTQLTEDESSKHYNLSIIEKYLSEYQSYLLKNTPQTAAEKANLSRGTGPFVTESVTDTTKTEKTHNKLVVVQNLLNAVQAAKKSDDMNQFNQEYGHYEDYLTVNRSFDVRYSQGKKMMDVIKENIPDLTTSIGYKVGRILAAIDEYRTFLAEKLQSATGESATSYSTINTRLTEIENNLNRAYSNSTTNSANSVTITLSPESKIHTFYQLYTDPNFQADLKKTSQQGFISSLFSYSPGEKFMKRITDIMPEVAIPTNRNDKTLDL